MSLGDKAHIYTVSSEASDAFSLIIWLMLLITEMVDKTPMAQLSWRVGGEEIQVTEQL